MPQVIIMRRGVQESWVGGPVKGHSHQEYTTCPALKDSHGSSGVLPRMPGFGGLYQGMQGMQLPHRAFFKGLTCAACTGCYVTLIQSEHPHWIFCIEGDNMPLSQACTIHLVLLSSLLEDTEKRRCRGIQGPWTMEKPCQTP